MSSYKSKPSTVVELMPVYKRCLMTTTQIPAWAKEFEVVTSEEEAAQTGSEEFEKLLNEKF